MPRAEYTEMIALAERLIAAGETPVLATLFSSQGSTYRPLGSMMLSGFGTSYVVGGVSGGCLEGYIARRGRELIAQYSATILSFDTDPDNAENSLYQMYIINRDPELTGDVVTDAAPDFDPQSGQPMVRMAMNADGASRWSTITGQNIGKRVAIVLDSAVYSAPVVQNKIPGGSSQITGSKDAKEANLLAVVLKAGALKAPVKIIEERIVGPSLGEDG